MHLRLATSAHIEHMIETLPLHSISSRRCESKQRANPKTIWKTKLQLLKAWCG